MIKIPQSIFRHFCYSSLSAVHRTLNLLVRNLRRTKTMVNHPGRVVTVKNRAALSFTVTVLGQGSYAQTNANA